MAGLALISQALWTFIKYAFVGAINTVVGSLTMIIFAYVGLNYVISTLLGYLVGFVSSYTSNGSFTFETNRLSSQELLLFGMLNGVLLALVESIQILMIGYFGVRELLGVSAGMASYSILGFLLNRRYVFKVPKRRVNG
jgi:putative flippase GtrA